MLSFFVFVFFVGMKQVEIKSSHMLLLIFKSILLHLNETLFSLIFFCLVLWTLQPVYWHSQPHVLTSLGVRKWIYSTRCSCFYFCWHYNTICPLTVSDRAASVPAVRNYSFCASLTLEQRCLRSVANPVISTVTSSALGKRVQSVPIQRECNPGYCYCYNL